VCLERDCLPSKQCQLYAGCALKEEAPTQVACVWGVCYPALSNGKTKATVLAVFHCCCLLSGVVYLASSVGYREAWYFFQ